MAENLFFRKGTVAGLKNAPIINGSVCFTTDEPAIYLDANGTRKRIGDIIQVAEIKSIVASVTADENGKPIYSGVVTDWQGRISEWSESALYYAIKENALLKYIKPVEGETTGTWVQINATSDVQANLTALSTKVSEIEKTVTSHDTAINKNTTDITDITKEGGKIDVAKNAAISAAATDATTKADKALVDAQTYVNNALKDYVDDASYQATLTTLATKTEVSTAVSTLKSQSIDPLADKIGKAATEDGGPTGIYDLIAKEANRADLAEKGLDQKITNLNNTLTTAYETKTDAAAKLAEAKQAVKDLSDGAVATNAANITKEKERAEAAENALGLRIDGVAEDIKAINTALTELPAEYVSHTELNTTLGDFSTDAVPGNGLRKEVEDKIKTASNGLDQKINNLSTVVDGKVDATAYNTKVAAIEKSITDNLATAKTYAEEKAGAAQTAAVGAAKNYTDGQIKTVNEALGKKVSSEDFNTAVSTLEGQISAAQTAAVGAAKTYTNAEIAKAKTAAETAVSNAKTELQGKIDKKLDITAFNTFVGAKASGDTAASGIYADIDAAKVAANAYTDQQIAKELAAADAMTFQGVIGGQGSEVQALPAAVDTKAGDTYKVGAEGTYAGYQCSVGDLLIAKEDGKDEYYHIASGYEDDYTEYLNASDSEKKITLTTAVGTPKGSITFGEVDADTTVTGTQSNIVSTMVSVTDEKTRISNTTVTFNMVWGEF